MTPPASEASPAGPDDLGPIWRPLMEVHLAHRAEALLVKDLSDGRYRIALGNLQGLLGLTPAQALGRTDAELFGQEIATMLRAADQAALSHGGPMAAEHALEVLGARRQRSALRVVFPGPGSAQLGCFWSDPEPQRRQQHQLAGALEQIEQLQLLNRQMRRELAEQLSRDLHSGLQTRAHFEEQLRRELDLSQREQRDFSAVLLEVDPPSGPAPARDAPSGPAPDRDAAELEHILEAVGRVLKGGTRAMDACCRLEGGRFAVLLSGVGLATAHSRTEALRRLCATQIVVVGGREVRFSVSAGVASFPHTASDGDELLAACESALQRACRRGGNQVALATVRFGPT